MCQWQIAARCENEFGACVHEHSCCSVETAILSTSLQYPSVLQNREPKWENPMSPYKSRLFTGNHPKCLENTGFRGSVLIPRKMVNSVVYAISLKTQNQVPQGVPVRVRPPAPRRQKKPAPFRFRLAAKTARCWLLQHMMDIQFRLEKESGKTAKEGKNIFRRILLTK